MSDIIVDTSGNAETTKRAKENSAINEAAKKVVTAVAGSKEANDAAAEREKAAATKYPDSAEAKFQKASDFFKGVVGKKAGGKVSSASKRADGCCIRGKTRA